MPHLETPFNKWVVALGASYSIGWSLGYVSSGFLFVNSLMDIFDIKYTDTALVSSAMLSLCYLSLTANVLFNHFGYRKSIMGAALLCTFSQVSAAFASEYWLMVMLLGILNGLGVSVLFNGPVMVAGYLFTDIDRHKAMAIVYAGVGGGLMLMPIVFELFAQEYSFRGCLIMLAGLTLQIFVAGSLMPDKLIYADEDRKYSRGTSKESLVKYQKSLLDRSASGAPLIAQGTIPSVQPDEHAEPTFYQRFIDAFRPHLLKDWRLQLLNGASFFFAFILAVMSSFNESILVVDYGLSLTERTALVAAGGAASIIGRLSVGLFPKTKVLPRWWIWSMDGFLEGLSMALLGLFPSVGLPGAAFAQVLYGYTLGFIFTMHAVVLGDIFPSADFAAAYGFNAFVMMIASLIAPVFSGWLGDITNSFRIPLYVAGFSQMAGFSLPLVGLFVSRCWNRFHDSTDNRNVAVVFSTLED